MYRDSEPEDAWDDGDTDDEKLDILERVVLELSDRHRRDDRFDFRRVDALRLARKVAPSTRLDAIREQLETLD